MVDTLAIARTRFPGAKHSLDALCTRFGIDRSHRVRHGALLDAELLTHVYIELKGGRQIGLGLEAAPRPAASTGAAPPSPAPSPASTGAGTRTVRLVPISEQDIERHRAFVARMKAPLWAGRETAAANRS
jgi:DNA polymerase-3 subunit epsilon